MNKYVWPVPVFVILVAAGGGAAILARDIFMAVHGLIEIGVLVCLVASLIFSLRLWRVGSADVPRWVFYLNLSGPLMVLVIFLVDWLGALR